MIASFLHGSTPVELKSTFGLGESVECLRAATRCEPKQLRLNNVLVGADDELGELLQAHNELGRALREQRAHLAQRELLLDTVTQNSPVALVLVDAHQRVVYPTSLHVTC